MLSEIFASGFSNVNVLDYVRQFLLSLPPFVLALTFHEAAHAYVANRCGDPTARLMGRLTLNPIKHIDPMGLICLLLFRLGWAKAVPVNPNNFRNYRRDDLKVSLAGVSANLLLFLVSCLIMFGFVTTAVSKVPAEDWKPDGTAFYTESMDQTGWYEIKESEPFTHFYSMGEYLVGPMFGNYAMTAYDMIYQFALINLILAAFNLLPIPPLDGYHVLNDLVLKRPLFAPDVISRFGWVALLVLSYSGLLSKGINFVLVNVFGGVGTAMNALHGLFSGF